MLQRMKIYKGSWKQNNWNRLNERTFDFFEKLTTKSKKKCQYDIFRNGGPVTHLFLRDCLV